jgi:hypothetical protein
MPGAQGGTYAAPVWHAFMQPAAGDDCGDFPEPQQPAEFQPFFGKYASTGAPTTTTYGTDDGTIDDTAGGTGTDQEFDPRYYEEAPQNAPEVQLPEQTAPPTGGEEGGAAPPQ